MLKLLKHKNIVSIDSCVTLPSMQVAFVMDYLDGGEILAYVESKFKK
jgi:serine/threonine protein kinase